MSEKDFLGRSKQRWGICNNLRAVSGPSFEEAAFGAGAEGVTRIGVEIAP
ncbi:MAG: hypothetical protein ABSG76_13225 [Xanthobacteraceae bacterium]|jgi:hypothetical protein